MHSNVNWKLNLLWHILFRIYRDPSFQLKFRLQPILAYYFGAPSQLLLVLLMRTQWNVKSLLWKPHKRHKVGCAILRSDIKALFDLYSDVHLLLLPSAALNSKFYCSAVCKSHSHPILLSGSIWGALPQYRNDSMEVAAQPLRSIYRWPFDEVQKSRSFLALPNNGGSLFLFFFSLYQICFADVWWNI